MDPAVEEKMFFFHGSGGRRLLGFLHGPGRAGPFPAVLYCHPFAEEKNLSHVIAVKTARALAREGFTVMRLDLSGCGDSEGELPEVTLEDWLEDIRLAAEHVRNHARVSGVVFWGLRTGAYLAMAAALGCRDLRGLILWQPVGDLRLFMHQFLRQSISADLAAGGAGASSVKHLEARIQAGETLEVIGYPVGPRLFRSMTGARRLPGGGKAACPALFLTMGASESASPAQRKDAETLEAEGASVRAAHLQQEPFWNKYWCWEAPRVTDATAVWCREALA